MAEMKMYTDPGMERRTVPEFLEKASACDAPLLEVSVQPEALVTIKKMPDGSAAAVVQQKWIPAAEQGGAPASGQNGSLAPGPDSARSAVSLTAEPAAEQTGPQANTLISEPAYARITRRPVLHKGESICLDLGSHYVGYVTLTLNTVGSPQDAPAFVKLKFAEIPQEILDDSAAYNGWISRGWIQEEWLHLDVLPAEIRLPRRYAFRYLEICALDTSNKFSLVVEDATLTAVSAVSMDVVPPLNFHAVQPPVAGDAAQLSEASASQPVSEDAAQPTGASSPETVAANSAQPLNTLFSGPAADGSQPRSASAVSSKLAAIDRIACRTLQNCMQHVFEDGPKRDRRLWLGDFRLQAKTNYYTFKNYALVKRCLYLFAGTTRADGRIAACLFTEPQVVCDDTFLWDFSLFFVSALYDYFAETKDAETLSDLWPAAFRQIELARADMADGILTLSEDSVNVFIDWKEGLERQAAAQGVFIYVLRQALILAETAGIKEQTAYLQKLLDDAWEKAVSVFWDEERQCFVSGKGRQAAKISQAWMVLADVLPREKSAELMLRTMADDTMPGVLTPYAYHCLTEAMLHAGEPEKALEMIETYWGGMADLGADTFWEAYDPDDPYTSPYDNMQVNSFCHAWSCTPAWLLREILEIRSADFTRINTMNEKIKADLAKLTI